MPSSFASPSMNTLCFPNSVQILRMLSITQTQSTSKEKIYKLKQLSKEMSDN
jgi:hypothetical protein